MRGFTVQPSALSVSGLTYSFPGEAPLFDNLSLAIREGEIVTLLAASGIGKTTLFRLIAGVLAPQSGVITIGGGIDSSSSDHERRAGRIGYMPQKDCLMAWRTVLDNAALGMELAGTPRKEARKRVLELLPAFGLEGTENKHPHELSGGMRQRVSFLRSVLAGGSLLLLDEPFSALDAMTRIGMQEWLLHVWESNRKTILFVTHDVDEALLLSDRVLVATSTPITELKELTVPLRRPRTYDSVMGEAFISLKRQALELLGRQSAIMLKERSQ